ncbi:hypothetical protein B0H15DRAFT_931414 [Mycena belliarum]|uniref:Uncharacterized protein n=1 Tax=Mycena belliarum TaxID=1033014 RepID=A0AAD6U464_9AGAR|nr:hypothetical protein B0H15DRAFT_931414 [Mycena belliae]
MWRKSRQKALTVYTPTNRASSFTMISLSTAVICIFVLGFITRAHTASAVLETSKSLAVFVALVAALVRLDQGSFAPLDGLWRAQLTPPEKRARPSEDSNGVCFQTPAPSSRTKTNLPPPSRLEDYDRSRSPYLGQLNQYRYRYNRSLEPQVHRRPLDRSVPIVILLQKASPYPAVTPQLVPRFNPRNGSDQLSQRGIVPPSPPPSQPASRAPLTQPLVPDAPPAPLASYLLSRLQPASIARIPAQPILRTLTPMQVDDTGPNPYPTDYIPPQLQFAVPSEPPRLQPFVLPESFNTRSTIALLEHSRNSDLLRPEVFMSDFYENLARRDATRPVFAAFAGTVQMELE